MSVHVFAEDLEYSERAPHELAIERAAELRFAPAFGRQIGAVWAPRDSETQRRARVDLLLLFDAAPLAPIAVEVKVRRRDYADVAIETHHEHRDGRRVPGWIAQPSLASWLVYVMAPSGQPATVRWFSWPDFVAAYRRNERSWHALAAAQMEGFRRAESPNRDYVSVSLVVPIARLQRALAEQALFTGFPGCT